MTKQVALANRTYERLRAMRRQGESFSQAIELLMGRPGLTADDIARELPTSDTDWDAVLARLEAERDEDRIRF